MLQLIDQSDLDRPIYRCPACGEQGASSISRAADGMFLDIKSKPARWFRHICKPAEAPESKPARRAREAAES